MKLIPGIHMTADGNKIELIHAFALKLREDISRGFFARDINYPTLMALIEAAKRYETKTTSIAVDEPISTTQSDISPLATVEHVDSSQESVTPVHPASPNKDLADVAFRLGTYFECKPSKSAVASEACKFLYESFPPSREILAKHGRLRSLVKSCQFLHLEGAPHGGIYVLSLDVDKFSRLRR